MCWRVWAGGGGGHRGLRWVSARWAGVVVVRAVSPHVQGWSWSLYRAGDGDGDAHKRPCRHGAPRRDGGGWVWYGRVRRCLRSQLPVSIPLEGRAAVCSGHVHVLPLPMTGCTCLPWSCPSRRCETPPSPGRTVTDGPANAPPHPPPTWCPRAPPWSRDLPWSVDQIAPSHFLRLEAIPPPAMHIRLQLISDRGATRPPSPPPAARCLP